MIVSPVWSSLGKLANIVFVVELFLHSPKNILKTHLRRILESSTMNELKKSQGSVNALKSSTGSLTITLTSSYSEAITFNNGRFKNITKETFEQSKKNFKGLDADSDGFLDLHDVTKMMEKLKETKTVTEIRKMIAEIDDDKDGKISFLEFLQMLAGPAGASSDSGVTELTLFGRIYGSNLGNHAAFFEQAAMSTRDRTEDNKAQIKKEYEEKKKMNEARKAEQDKEKAEKEAKDAAAQESRARLNARAALFAKGG